MQGTGLERICTLNTCGITSSSGDACEGNDGCNIKFFKRGIRIINYTNGATSTSIRTRQGYLLQCQTVNSFTCQEGPNGATCNGPVSSTSFTCEEPLESFSEKLANGKQTCTGPCPDPLSGYTNYRFGFLNNFSNACQTIGAPSPNFCDVTTFSTSAIKYDMSKERDRMGNFLGYVERKVKCRILHYPTPTCYLRIWLRIRTTKLIKVFTSVPNQPCFGWSLQDGETTEEIIDAYEWNGSGRPCFETVIDENGNLVIGAGNPIFKKLGCENVITSGDFELVAGDFELKTIGVYKYSFVAGYEPSNPSLSGYPTF